MRHPYFGHFYKSHGANQQTPLVSYAYGTEIACGAISFPSLDGGLVTVVDLEAGALASKNAVDVVLGIIAPMRPTVVSSDRPNKVWRALLREAFSRGFVVGTIKGDSMRTCEREGDFGAWEATRPYIGTKRYVIRW